MATSLAAVNGNSEKVRAELPNEGSDVTRWYAVLTRARHEKSVAAQLDRHEIEHFLPVYKSLRSWKDRRLLLDLPLFPGYLFVHTPITQRLRVLQVAGVAQFVGFGGHAAAVPDEDIYQIHELLSRGIYPKPHPYLKVGKRVRICEGALRGFEGTIVRAKAGARFVISIDSIQRSVAVEIEEAALRSVSERSKTTLQ